MDGKLTVACHQTVVARAHSSASGGDMGQVEPTLEEIRERLDAKPEDYLVDRRRWLRQAPDRRSYNLLRAPVVAPEVMLPSTA